VVIRRVVAVVSGVLAVLAGSACTAAPPSPRATATTSRSAPHQADWPEGRAVLFALRAVSRWPSPET